MPQFVAGGVLTPGAPSRIASRPLADSGRPWRGPFNTTKIRSVQQAPVRDLYISQAQAQHLAAAQPDQHHAQHHRRSRAVRSAAISRSTSSGARIQRHAH